jgi:hypothetical protein
LRNKEELAGHLDENTYLNSGDVGRYVEKTYGIEYSPTGMKELLHRLNFVYKKPKHVPGKLDPAKQEVFLHEYVKLRKNKGENDPVYFGDGCHPQYNGIPAFGWIRRAFYRYSVLPVLRVKNSGRKRVNINGTVNVTTMETVTDFLKTINGASSLRLFKKSRRSIRRRKRFISFWTMRVITFRSG